MKRGQVNIVTAVSQSEKRTCRGDPIRRQRTGGVSLGSLRKATNTTLHHQPSDLNFQTEDAHFCLTHRAHWKLRDESPGKSGSETREIQSP